MSQSPPLSSSLSLPISFPPNSIAQPYPHYTIQEKKAEINIVGLETKRRDADVHGQEEEARLKETSTKGRGHYRKRRIGLDSTPSEASHGDLLRTMAALLINFRDSRGNT